VGDPLRTLDAKVATDPVTVNVVEGADDLGSFRTWLTLPRTALGLDVETTGLNIYGGDTLRLVQFGDADAAYILNPNVPAHAAAVAEAIATAPRLVLHNAPFDLLVLDHAGLLVLEDVWPRVFDTRTMSHLLDPRGKHEGGTGHGLKALAEHHVGDGAADYEVALKAKFRKLKLTVETGWAGVPLDDEDYLRYSGMDPILTVRLFNIIGYSVVGSGLSELFSFEKEVGLVTAKMQRKGIRMDPAYAHELDAYLTNEEADGIRDAAAYGIDNVNSTSQVAEVLTALGANLVEKTETGNPKVDKAVLEALVSNDGPAAPAAAAVLRAKRAGKFRTTYVDGCMALRDAHDRVHPFINPLQARTARMSISDPPLQQLPSGDWRIRRLFVPSDGMAIISVDYSQVEMRVLAALSGDRNMTEAILSGEDLHSSAAKLMFGDDFTDKQRKLAKVAGFAKVYGGGAAVIARQTGVDLETAKHATSRYDRAFPGIKRYGRRLQDRAEHGARSVVTPSGRRLPLDRDRLYAATNYVVQSTARDVMAQALVKLDDAGLSDYLLLPIHDEVLAEAPAADAADIARSISEAMELDFMGIPLTTDTDVATGSWGTLYGADA
jgi:DNA polymerase I